MKKITCLIVSTIIWLTSCSSPDNENKNDETTVSSSENHGQSGISDANSNPNIIQVASSNNDFTTLVAAVKAAGLVDALSNAGPFTVFAPTNSAFDKLPKGTVDDLLKPEKKSDLENILGYHTYVGVLDGILLQDGMVYEMVYGGKIKISVKDSKTYVNDVEILKTIKVSNGVIHVIGEVLLPLKK